MPNFDDRDAAILAERQAAFLDRDFTSADVTERFRQGDVVVFPCGKRRRISYVWDRGVQTSDGGSYYLGNGYMRMSGSLFPSVPVDSLTLSDERADVSAWFFHHDMRRAHNGVPVTVSVPVWACSVDAPM